MIAEYGLEKFEKIVIFLSRFSEVKQPLKLADAARHLPEDWGVLFFGHGPLEHELKEAEKDLPNVKVFPPIRHPGDILQIADVMAMPSIAEGHPLSANEAWLAGVPVVATEFSFSLEHSQMFSLIPQDATPEQFAMALINAANGIEPTTEDVVSIFYVAMEHYTASAFVQRWEEYLFAVVASRLQNSIFGSIK